MTSGLTSERARNLWLEPLLAGLVLILGIESVIAYPSVTAAVTVAVLAACAATSAIWPNVSATIAVSTLALGLAWPSDPTAVAGLSLFINIFSATRFQLKHRRLLTALIFTTVFVVMVVHAAGGLEHMLPAALVLLVLLSLSIGAGRHWRLAQERVLDARRLATAQLAEIRGEIARDLHDTVAQTLSHVAMRAHLASFEPKLPSATQTELTVIADECSSSAAELRELLSTLRALDGSPVAQPPDPLANAASLATDLEAQADRLRAAGFTADAASTIVNISAARASTLSKIATEATTNILKHARPSSHCKLSLTESPDGAIVAEFINERQTTRVARDRLGVIGMEERAKILNGAMKIIHDDHKWTVRVELPGGHAAQRSNPLES